MPTFAVGKIKPFNLSIRINTMMFKHLGLRSTLTAALLSSLFTLNLQAEDNTAADAEVNYYLYILNEDGTDIASPAMPLGTKVTRGTNDIITADVQLMPGDKFVVCTQPNATSLEGLEGRMYPGKEDARDIELFNTIEVKDEAIADMPEYFTVGKDVCTSQDDHYYILINFLPSSWYDPEHKHHHLMLLPNERDIQLMTRYGAEDELEVMELSDLYNEGKCGMAGIYDMGVYSMRFRAQETAPLYFAWRYANGTRWLTAKNIGDNNNGQGNKLISYDKDNEGLGFRTGESLTDDNGQELTYYTAMLNEPNVTKDAAYEAVLDLNEINRVLSTEKSVYLNHWIFGSNQKIELRAHVTRQGSGEEVNIHGDLVRVYVQGVKPEPYGKFVWAYKFDLDFDLITPETQNYFYFRVTTPDEKEFSIVPFTRNWHEVFEGYDNAIPSTNYENENAMFDFMKFAAGGKYSFFIEPNTSNVWLQAQDNTVTSITDLEATDFPAVDHYYDLNGREVVNPQHGIYIQLHGTEAHKVVL